MTELSPNAEGTNEYTDREPLDQDNENIELIEVDLDLTGEVLVHRC